MRRALVLFACLTVAGCGERREAPEPRVVSIVQDDAELLYREPAQLAATLDDLRDSGVDWIRITAGWGVIAPQPEAATKPTFDATDPDAYPPGAWDRLDRAIAGAAERGMRANVDIAFWAPRWAVGRAGTRADRERDRIDPAAFADFAQAVARRYPQAAAFTVWNEPNHNAFLLPQFERGADGTMRPESPHEYRAMLRAAVPRIEAAAPDALVLIGATSSVGAVVGEERDDRMSPLVFARELACVDEDLEPLDRPECADFQPLPGDGWSHHPYALDRPPWASDPRPETVRMGDLGRLTGLLGELRRRGRTSKPLPLYLTEFGYQTNPPDPTWDITLEDQARWLPEAERVAREQPGVKASAQFTVRDLPERPGPTLRVRWRDYQAGLRFQDGRAKPAHAAYALGLTARRAPGGGVAFWGHLRPGEGERDVRIEQQQADGAWTALTVVRTDAEGTFTAAVPGADPDSTFRLEHDGRTGPPLVGAR